MTLTGKESPEPVAEIVCKNVANQGYPVFNIGSVSVGDITVDFIVEFTSDLTFPPDIFFATPDEDHYADPYFLEVEEGKTGTILIYKREDMLLG
jgi:hypothetical protein